jgi:hypothetical protein
MSTSPQPPPPPPVSSAAPVGCSGALSGAPVSPVSPATSADGPWGIASGCPASSEVAERLADVGSGPALTPGLVPALDELAATVGALAGAGAALHPSATPLLPPPLRSPVRVCALLCRADELADPGAIVAGCPRGARAVEVKPGLSNATDPPSAAPSSIALWTPPLSAAGAAAGAPPQAASPPITFSISFTTSVAASSAVDMRLPSPPASCAARHGDAHAMAYLCCVFREIAVVRWTGTVDVRLLVKPLLEGSTPGSGGPVGWDTVLSTRLRQRPNSNQRRCRARFCSAHEVGRQRVSARSPQNTRRSVAQRHARLGASWWCCSALLTTAPRCRAARSCLGAEGKRRRLVCSSRVMLRSESRQKRSRARRAVFQTQKWQSPPGNAN